MIRLDDDVGVVLGTTYSIIEGRGRCRGKMVILIVREGVDEVKISCWGEARENALRLERGDTVFAKVKTTAKGMTAMAIKKSGWFNGTRNGLNVHVYAARASEIIETETGAIVTLPLRVYSDGAFKTEIRTLYCSANASKTIWSEMLPGEMGLFVTTESGECIECSVPA